jgi:DNA-binding NarL/FixJ family response regulator
MCHDRLVSSSPGGEVLRGGDATSGAVLEGLAEALYLDCDYASAAAHYERAYAAYRRDGQHLAAGLAARMVGWITGNVLGDWAVQNGWWARARNVLAQAGSDGPEHAWVLIIDAMSELDPHVAETSFREAITIGRRLGDPDIEFDALAGVGAMLLVTDRVGDALAIFDEALAAVCAGELTNTASVDSMLCMFLWACERVNDVPRADQWMRAAADIMQRKNVAAAFCRAHYGGILTAAGRWEEAETELLQAANHFDRGMSTRREDAIIRLAELRVRQGRLEEAAQLLKGLGHHPDAVRTRAALHLARGEATLAQDLLERAIAGRADAVQPIGETPTDGPMLALLVDVHLEQGDVDAAARAAQRLDRIAAAQHGPYLRAAAALANGQVCMASGQGDARACLHDALEGFARAQLPMELARTRLEIARALAEQSPKVAIAEATMALEAFENLEAARHADAAGALLRSLGAPIRTGPKGVGTLTKREAEVLQLIGAGLSNPEIGDRLFITRKTVETHVGNLLAKLGLRNRAEAAAYVARENLSPRP